MTQLLFKKCSLDESRKPIYRYGFQLFLSTSASTTAILLLSAFFSLFSHAVIFLLVFMPLRFFSGGYHAKTYGNCFILTNAVYWLTATATLLFGSFPVEMICLFIYAPFRRSRNPSLYSRLLLAGKMTPESRTAAGFFAFSER